MHDLIHCFIESYQNGFYQMQTTPETIAAFIGASVWDVQNFITALLTK